jgi:hypothetical protein
VGTYERGAGSSQEAAAREEPDHGCTPELIGEEGLIEQGWAKLGIS